MLKTIRRKLAMNTLTKAATEYQAAIGDFSVPLEVALIRANMAKATMRKATNTLWHLRDQ